LIKLPKLTSSYLNIPTVSLFHFLFHPVKKLLLEFLLVVAYASMLSHTFCLASSCFWLFTSCTFKLTCLCLAYYMGNFYWLDKLLFLYLRYSLTCSYVDHINLLFIHTHTASNIYIYIEFKDGKQTVYSKVYTDDQLNSIILTHQITILKLIYIFGKTIEKARCIP
jgi:hypothetical protein